MALDNTENIISAFKKFEKRSYSKWQKLYTQVKDCRDYIAGDQLDKDDQSLIGKEASSCKLNITQNAIRTIVNTYLPHQYKWQISDNVLNDAGIKFLDDIDNNTAAVEALTNAVGTGIGVLVFSNDYAVDGSVKPILYSVKDVTNVRLDANISKLNGSDANEAAIIELKSRNYIQQQYGMEYLNDKPLVDISEDYDRKEYIPLVTYYKKEDGVITCYKMLDDTVLEATSLPYTYIPVIPVFGEQSWNSDHEATYTGITEQLKAIQRLVNYAYRQLIIRCSKSPKNTWACESESIEGNEQYYKNADKSLNPLLIYNGWSADGQRQLPKPERISNEIQFNDVSTLMQNALGLTNTLIGIPATGLETEVSKTATEVLTNEKTFNNNVRAYLQHLKYSLQVIGLLFCEEVSQQPMYGKVTVDMIEGPDAAMERQEARIQLQSYAPLITDENDKKALLLAECNIERNNQYIQDFMQRISPQINPMDAEAQQLIAQANNEIKTRDSQILELQKQIEDLKNQQQIQAYGLEREMLLNKQKFEQEYQMKLLEAQLNGNNVKQELDIRKDELELEKKAVDLRNAQLDTIKKGI